jgi:class 3 adenylate cyclase
VDVETWLRGLGLEQYLEAFQANAIDVHILPELTADDVKELGVGPVGHRRKLLAAIAALRADRSLGNKDPSGPRYPPPARAKATSREPQSSVERRRLTIMFCDLVGSTALSSRLDPEDLREVIGAYYQCCAEVVDSFDGYLARHLGDGVLSISGIRKRMKTIRSAQFVPALR